MTKRLRLAGFAGALALAAFLGTAANAQRPEVNSPTSANRLDCVTTFRTLDSNANGVLEPREMNASDAALPTNVSTSVPISETDFVSRCSGDRMLPQGTSAAD